MNKNFCRLMGNKRYLVQLMNSKGVKPWWEKILVQLYERFYKNDIESKHLIEILNQNFPDEWLLRYELYKNSHQFNEDWVDDLYSYLYNYQEKNIDLNNAIKRGLNTI